MTRTVLMFRHDLMAKVRQRVDPLYLADTRYRHDVGLVRCIVQSLNPDMKNSA